MKDGSPKATDYVASWITSHRKEIGGTQLKVVQQEIYGRTFCAEFETPKYLIQFCAWDHASCLDIIALNKDTGRTAYSVSGVCDGAAGLSERLHSFLSWLNVNEPTRIA